MGLAWAREATRVDKPLMLACRWASAPGSLGTRRTGVGGGVFHRPVQAVWARMQAMHRDSSAQAGDLQRSPFCAARSCLVLVPPDAAAHSEGRRLCEGRPRGRPYRRTEWPPARLSGGHHSKARASLRRPLWRPGRLRLPWAGFELGFLNALNSPSTPSTKTFLS